MARCERPLRATPLRTTGCKRYASQPAMRGLCVNASVGGVRGASTAAATAAPPVAGLSG
jgi:hypothetical protein